MPGEKALAAALGNVMKTRDGEPLAGGASAESDFAGIGATAAPGYPQQPAYGGAPVGLAAINPLTGQPL